jgi:hypothetical protein
MNTIHTVISSGHFNSRIEENKMEEKIERPEFVTNDMLEFLDDLRESGDTNMWGARPYLLDEYPELSKQEAGKVLVYWIETFGNPDR